MIIKTVKAYVGAKDTIYKTEDEAKASIEKEINVNKMVKFFQELGHRPTDSQQRKVLKWFEKGFLEIRYE